MFKHRFLFSLLIACTATHSNAVFEPKKDVPSLLSFFTAVQPSQLTTENAKTVFAPIAALHALEHMVGGNNAFGRMITGDTNNPNRKTAVCLYLATKLAFHVLPTLLNGGSILEGIDSFINSGQLAIALLAPPTPERYLPTPYDVSFRTEPTGPYAPAISALLILNQCRRVYNVHKQVADECATLKIENPFTRAFIEPSATHIKLPRYLTQDLLPLWFLRTDHFNIMRWKTAEHFNREFSVYTNPNEYEASYNFRPTRILNDPLIERRSPESMFLLLKIAIMRLVSVILGTGASAISTKWFNGKYISLIDSKFLFISEETFEQLSEELQNTIVQLNQQELVYNVYNVTNPETEHAFQLALYTDFTEPIHFTRSTTGGVDTHNYQAIISRLTNPEYQNLNPLNLKEQCLWPLIAYYDTETLEHKQQARAYAQEVLAVKPVSRLAKKVIELTADLDLTAQT